MRLSTVILPLARWPESRDKWRRAEELGFYAAYTYDHLWWLSLRDGPWFGALPTLTAAAVETSTIRLGTLVTSPNFRHPVPLAKDFLTLDDVSNGRLIVGAGAGGAGNDSAALGGEDWTQRERTDRFVEFVSLLDELLREPLTSRRGAYYSANEVRMLPGTLQRPRPPFCIAAAAPRSFAVAVEYGQAWVTYGLFENPQRTCLDAVTSQVANLNNALDTASRPRNDIERVLLDGLSDERPLASLDAFVDWAGRYQALGMTELVIHWPEPDCLFDFNMTTFEKIATEGLAQL